MGRATCALGHCGLLADTGICNAVANEESPVTVILRCQNCGFSFTVTYPTQDTLEADTIPVACGHCRSTRWSAQSA